MIAPLRSIFSRWRRQQREDPIQDLPGFIRTAYRDTIEREPGEEELAAALDMLRRGLDREAFLFGIIRSDEFRSRRAADRRRFQQDEDIRCDGIFMNIHDRCKEFTMTSLYNMYALYAMVGHVVKHDIPGDLVECGVWRGGSSMLTAMTLLHLGDTGRKIYLYDTFEGMPRPGTLDVRFDGTMAEPIWQERKAGQMSTWAFARIEDVMENMKSTGFPMGNVIFVRGRVEETIPGVVPERIAIVRLDTDWYESTIHELTHLFPLLERGGGLLIDDYGWWKGCREAVDEYFSESGHPMLLHRICPSGARAGIKL